jgi:tRNA-2-methylthio-N6-dimethylallyladenosine synthase
MKLSSLTSLVNFPRNFFLKTYGCQMNVADSEVVASVMKMAGYGVTEDLNEADAIFINTCSVRDNAEQKIYTRLNQINAMRPQTQQPAHRRHHWLYG